MVDGPTPGCSCIHTMVSIVEDPKLHCVPMMFIPLTTSNLKDKVRQNSVPHCGREGSSLARKCQRRWHRLRGSSEVGWMLFQLI